jgi:predicted amidophosphoribosyltransferase
VNDDNASPAAGATMPPNASLPALPERFCRACAEPIRAAYRFCPHCGRRQQSGDAWYYDPVWILVLALFAIGPFALILVWRSKRMNRAMKAVFTAGILVYSGYTFYCAYRLIQFELNALSELNVLLQ